ncbi:MAG: hypothetical protein IKI58_11590 [Oscillospiraceae bacterium]|nr:hypothetical protein [Oscillospiraceae bacterium]
MTLNTDCPALLLTLGDLSLPADDFALKAEIPVKSRVLCDGNVQIYMLTQTHCTLTVTGRIPQGGGAAVCPALQREMHAHTAFAFSFAGADFSDMQITALSCKTQNHRMLTDYTVTLTGRLTEEEEPA